MWMKESDLDYPICNLKETSKYLLKEQEMILTNLQLTNKTGCKPNCIYFKYEIIKVQPWTGSFGALDSTCNFTNTLKLMKI